jgi:hypothetical protein
MGEDGVLHKVLVRKPEGKRPLGRQNVVGRLILRWIFRKFVGGRRDWMGLAEDRNRWRALVGTARDFRVL